MVMMATGQARVTIEKYDRSSRHCAQVSAYNSLSLYVEARDAIQREAWIYAAYLVCLIISKLISYHVIMSTGSSVSSPKELFLSSDPNLTSSVQASPTSQNPAAEFSKRTQWQSNQLLE